LEQLDVRPRKILCYECDRAENKDKHLISYMPVKDMDI
jgi:hypothetical protein